MKQVECFGMPSDFQLAQLGSTKPNVFNGEVSVKRYRITVEEVVEPADVLRDRLIELQSGRQHVDGYRAIREAAVELGIDLPQRGVN